MGYSKIGDFSGYLASISAIQAFRKPVDFYDKVTFHGATRQIIIEDGTIKGFTVSGEVVSENWDGTIPVSLPDAGATVGYALDPTNGTAQFMGTVTIGGNLLVEDGTIYSNATTGHHLRIGGAATGPTYLDWFSNTTERAFISVGTGTHGIMTLNAAIDSSPGATQAVFELAAGSSWGNGSAHLYVSLENKSSVSRWYGPDGAEATPGYAFTNDPDTGMYRAGVNAIGFSAGGSKSFVITGSYAGSSNATGTPQMKIDAAGSAATPAYTFQGTTNMGMYHIASTALGFSVSGGRQFAIGTDGVSVGDGATTGQPYMRDSAGSVSAPIYSFIGDTNTGIYRAGVDTMGLTCGGNLVMSMNYTGGVKEVYIYGMTGTGAYNSVRVDTGTGKLYYLTSSRRFKTKITDAPYLSSVALRPRMFWQKNDKAWQYGLIAEEVAEVLPEAAVYQDEEVVNYDDRAVLAVLVAKVNRLEQALKDCHECGRIDTHDKEQS